VFLASSQLYRFDSRNRDETKAKSDFLAEIIKWAAEGKPAVGGTANLPIPMSGGGGIYPEKEVHVGGIVLYYAKNQFSQLLATVREEFNPITDQLYNWLPSPKPTEPMYMVLCSGVGGGWAINAYKPREVSTIAVRPSDVRGIFAHEQAHTMSGPCQAGDHPWGGNQGEPHAGWFQGKIMAMYDKTYAPNRNCQNGFRDEYDGLQTKAEDIFKERNLNGWKKQWDYYMVWYIWQKLDDRYGTTWYPRWRWVQQQRWADNPDHKLTWEESIEDMSIAVGEDLFPFIASTGKSLSKDRLEKIEFMGEQLILPVAPIKLTKPGNVNLEPAGDYTKPITIIE